MQHLDNNNITHLEIGIPYIFQQLELIYKDSTQQKANQFSHQLSQIFQLIFQKGWLQQAYDKLYSNLNDKIQSIDHSKNIFAIVQLLSPFSQTYNLFDYLFKYQQNIQFEFSSQYLPSHMKELINLKIYDHSYFQKYFKVLDLKKQAFKTQTNNFILLKHEWYLFVFFLNMKKFRCQSHKLSGHVELLIQDDLYADLLKNPYLILLRHYYYYFTKVQNQQMLQKMFFLQTEYSIIDPLFLYKPNQSCLDFHNIIQVRSFNQFGNNHSLIMTTSQVYTPFLIPQPHIFQSIILLIYFKMQNRDEDLQVEFFPRLYQFINCCLENWNKDSQNEISIIADLGRLWLYAILPWNLKDKETIEDSIKFEQQTFHQGHSSQLPFSQRLQNNQLEISALRPLKQFIPNVQDLYQQYFDINFVRRNILFYTVLFNKFLTILLQKLQKQSSNKEIDFLCNMIISFNISSEQQEQKRIEKSLLRKIVYCIKNQESGEKIEMPPLIELRGQLQKFGGFEQDEGLLQVCYNNRIPQIVSILIQQLFESIQNIDKSLNKIHGNSNLKQIYKQTMIEKMQLSADMLINFYDNPQCINSNFNQYRIASKTKNIKQIINYELWETPLASYESQTLYYLLIRIAFLIDFLFNRRDSYNVGYPVTNLRKYVSIKEFYWFIFKIVIIIFLLSSFYKFFKSRSVARY